MCCACDTEQHTRPIVCLLCTTFTEIYSHLNVATIYLLFFKLLLIAFYLFSGGYENDCTFLSSLAGRE